LNRFTPTTSLLDTVEVGELLIRQGILAEIDAVPANLEEAFVAIVTDKAPHELRLPNAPRHATR